MRVTTDSNFVYDDADERCLCIVSQTQGLAFAFIQCINAGDSGEGTELKRYWGSFDEENPEESIAQIMRRGGKWPELP